MRPARVLVGVVATVVLVACDSDSYRSPTAPYLLPSPETHRTHNGTMTIVSASPAGDCVADRFARATKRGSRVAFTIPPVEGSWTGSYWFELLGQSCDLRLASSRDGTLELELYPYCDVPYVQVEPIYTCDPELDASLVPTRVRMPAPAADGTIRGDGAVVMRLFDDTPAAAPIESVELAVYFDLHL